jgi:hypothetical protein
VLHTPKHRSLPAKPYIVIRERFTADLELTAYQAVHDRYAATADYQKDMALQLGLDYPMPLNVYVSFSLRDEAINMLFLTRTHQYAMRNGYRYDGMLRDERVRSRSEQDIIKVEKLSPRLVRLTNTQ